MRAHNFCCLTLQIALACILVCVPFLSAQQAPQIKSVQASSAKHRVRALDDDPAQDHARRASAPDKIFASPNNRIASHHLNAALADCDYPESTLRRVDLHLEEMMLKLNHNLYKKVPYNRFTFQDMLSAPLEPGDCRIRFEMFGKSSFHLTYAYVFELLQNLKSIFHQPENRVVEQRLVLFRGYSIWGSGTSGRELKWTPFAEARLEIIEPSLRVPSISAHTNIRLKRRGTSFSSQIEGQQSLPLSRTSNDRPRIDRGGSESLINPRPPPTIHEQARRPFQIIDPHDHRLILHIDAIDRPIVPKEKFLVKIRSVRSLVRRMQFAQHSSGHYTGVLPDSNPEIPPDSFSPNESNEKTNFDMWSFRGHPLAFKNILFVLDELERRILHKPERKMTFLIPFELGYDYVPEAGRLQNRIAHGSLTYAVDGDDLDKADYLR